MDDNNENKENLNSENINQNETPNLDLTQNNENEQNSNKQNNENEQNNNKQNNENEPNNNTTNNQKPLKRIFHYESIKSYWNNQKPNYTNSEFKDELFPTTTESLMDYKKETEYVNKISINEIEWKKLSEILTPNEITIFDKKEDKIDLSINFKENKGELFSHYTHFFHAINLLSTYPNIIEQIFKTKEINSETTLFELYIYINGEYKILLLDDYFPCVKGTTTLRFAKPNKNEIWLLLLEKAFAKVFGGYGSLLSCKITDIIIFFTGFSCERLNFFDIDYDDLENIIRVNKMNNMVFLTPNEENNEKIGILKGKAYQLNEIFDVKTTDSNGNEKNLKLVKIKNLFEYKKYTGDWNPTSNLWNDDIKRVINYNEDEKQVIYMSLENLLNYFNKISIIHTMLNCNTKIIKIEYEEIGIPNVFNLFIPQTSKVSFSIIVKQIIDKNNDIERCTPSNICISKYDPVNKKLNNFEGCFNSNENCEFARELEKGFYVIWTYLVSERSNLEMDEFYFKVSSDTTFKLNLYTQDKKFNLIKNMVLNAIMQYQGSHMKENEIYTMSDSFYNYTGLGLKIIYNPFIDCYQKWIFQPNMENMFLLYPYTKEKQIEIVVPPNKGNYLILSMKINSNKKCQFGLKSYFRTLKFKGQMMPIQEDFNFDDFCSKSIKDDELNIEYYNYLNDETLKKLNPNEEILQYLNNKYPEYMKYLNELEDDNFENLKYTEINDDQGIYIGQKNSNNEKEGKGIVIYKNTNNCFIGHWEKNLKESNCKLYDKDWNVILEGNFSKGLLNGKGMKILENGTRYEGNFENDKINGMGTYYFTNGSKWEGNSVNDKKEGIGKLTDSEGNVKDVEYKDDILVNNDNIENNENQEEEKKEENENNEYKEGEEGGN